MKKIIIIISAVIVLALSLFIYFQYYFVFGEGVKAGELNYIVKKGIMFKTYEGKLIQSGFRSSSKKTAVQSNEFEFSIVDEDVAQKLMLNSGKEMELHYREYRKALPWRGFSRYVVDKIIYLDRNKSQDKDKDNLVE